MKRLEEIGFLPVGTWRISSSELELSLHSMEELGPALYAFVVAGEVKYVGKTTQTLKQRLCFYRKPGKSQRTNIRVKAEIIAALGKVPTVEILGFHDPSPKKFGCFQLNLPAGLEDDIIAQLRPQWNGGRNQTAVTQREPAVVTDGQLESTPALRQLKSGVDALKPSFVVTIGKTYFRQGFLMYRSIMRVTLRGMVLRSLLKRQINQSRSMRMLIARLT